MFIYIGAINVILVVCACAGRCLLAEEGVDSYDDDDSSDNEREVNVEKGMTVVEQTNPVLVKAVVESEGMRVPHGMGVVNTTYT